MSQPLTKLAHAEDEGQPFHEARPSEPLTHQPVNPLKFFKSMNQLTSPIIIGSIIILVIALATLISKANLDMQWGEHQHIRISPGEAIKDK